MRKLFLLGTVVGVGLPVLAAAQPPPPPPPGGGYAGPETIAEPKMRVDVALIAGLPQGDESFDNVDTSPGLSAVFGITVAPNISVFGGFRYFAIQTKNEVDGVDLSNYDLIAGGRYAFPVSPTAKIFGEAMLIYSTLAVDAGGDEQSESGIGFGVRAGGQLRVSGNISVGGALSYSSANVEFEEGGASIDINAAWLGLEGFVSFGF